MERARGEEDVRRRPAYTHRDAAKPIWRAYLVGQLLGVSKAALWWSTVGLLAITILNNEMALGFMRCVFNLALLLCSPLAVQAAERTCSIRKILIRSTCGRLWIWTLFFPIAYLLTASHSSWMWGSLVLVSFFDGISAAYANSVDIDCGGLDILSSRYDLRITDYLRYKYTALHQAMFDCSFLFFVAPMLAIMTYFVHLPWSDIPGIHDIHHKAKMIFIVGVALIFTLLSLLSIKVYASGIPVEHHTATLPSSLRRTLQGNNTPPPVPLNVVDNGSNDGGCSWMTVYWCKLNEIFDGLVLVLTNRSLRWRLLFLATETALEDAMVSVIIPMGALYITPYFIEDPDILTIALISSICVGVGKLGGFLSGTFLCPRTATDYYEFDCEHADSAKRSSNPKVLFRSVLLSGMFLMLAPLGVFLTIQDVFWLDHVTHVDGLTNIAGVCISVIGVFLFFVFSTVPKIGFSSMIQSCMLIEASDAQAVFGFIGIFVTLADALMIIALNLMFTKAGPKLFDVTLMCVIGLYILHGLFEYCKGPALIRLPRAQMDQHP